MNIHPVLRKIIQLGSLFFIGLVLAACGAGSSSNDKSPAISTYAVTGTVTGDLVSGVTITLVNSANPTAGLFATSDTKGSYSFASLENGKYTATPAKTGYVFNPSSFAFEVSGANVILSPFSSKANVIQTYTISGKVTGDVTQNVKITLNSGASTLSTANGTYSFTGLSNGNYTLTPSLPGYDFSPASLSTTVKDSNVTLLNDFVATSLKTATYSISGTAATENGTALSGVTLSLTGFATTSTTTDASGKYSFPGLSNNSNYIVTPSKAGYIFSPNSVSANVSGADVSVVNFTATKDVAKTYTLSGTITGPGLAGVGLTLSPGGATTTSNASGNYSFPGLVNGNYTVTPSLANYTFTPSSVSANINNANATAVNLVSTALPPTQYTISGTVNGAVNVTINLTGALTANTTTDSNGNYSFSNLNNGNYTVAPVKTGFIFSPASTSVGINGASANGINFTASTTPAVTHMLSGTVTGAVTKGVLITLSGPISGTTTTNNSGNYSFTGLADGTYTASASLNGYTFSPTSRTATLSGADNTFASFTATALTYTISGNISGATLSGVTISLTGAANQSTTTDANGYYQFTNMLNGNYTVTPVKSGFSFSPGNRAVNVNGGSVSQQNFTATALTYTLSGSVTGSAVNGVTIKLSGASTASTATNAAGNFAFTGMANGTYTATPSLTGYTFSPASSTVTINGGNATFGNFAASAVVSTYTLSGMVTGAVISGVTINLSGASVGTMTTNANGRYTFSSLVNGTYTVTPSLSGYSFSPTSAQASINNANANVSNFVSNLILQSVYTISGKVTSISSIAGVPTVTPLAGWPIALSGVSTSTSATDVNGDYSFAGLANGSYIVTPQADPNNPSKIFTPTNRIILVNGANVTGQDFHQ